LLKSETSWGSPDGLKHTSSGAVFLPSSSDAPPLALADPQVQYMPSHILGSTLTGPARFGTTLGCMEVSAF
ncbi:MAG: hypothetical protein ABJZ69_19080, partial [Hyphomicrobiales bacterium]